MLSAYILSSFGAPVAKPLLLAGVERIVMDLRTLQETACIRVAATGRSITRLHATITNLVDAPLDVEIPPGTSFVAEGGHQDMVVVDELDFRLPPGHAADVTIRVACMNAGRSVPRAADRFEKIGEAPNEIRRFLEASGDLPPMALQAGVWALSDRYSRADVQRRLMRADPEGGFSPAITDEDLDRAGRALDSLWIPHRLGGGGQPGGASALIFPGARATKEEIVPSVLPRRPRVRERERIERDS